MQEANKVTCRNHADMVMKFQVKWMEGVRIRESGWTDFYSNPEMRSFDLDTFGLQDGSEAWIEVMTDLDSKEVSSRRFCYRCECKKETIYSVAGSTINYTID